jgi:hypothetical protein
MFRLHKLTRARNRTAAAQASTMVPLRNFSHIYQGPRGRELPLTSRQGDFGEDLSGKGMRTHASGKTCPGDSKFAACIQCLTREVLALATCGAGLAAGKRSRQGATAFSDVTRRSRFPGTRGRFRARRYPRCPNRARNCARCSPRTLCGSSPARRSRDWLRP